MVSGFPNGGCNPHPRVSEHALTIIVDEVRRGKAVQLKNCMGRCIICAMSRRSSKQKGHQRLACQVLDAVVPDADQASKKPIPQKNPAAVALGKLGEFNGGQTTRGQTFGHRRLQARWSSTPHHSQFGSLCQKTGCGNAQESSMRPGGG